MKIKVVHFHNKTNKNIFGRLIQLSVLINRQQKTIEAITKAIKTDKGYIITKEKVNFYCNHTGIAFERDGKWLIHMVSSGLKEEFYDLQDLTKRYNIFEEIIDVNRIEFLRQLKLIKADLKNYSYGWIGALASFRFAKRFLKLGEWIDNFFDKKRDKNIKKGNSLEKHCTALAIKLFFFPSSPANKYNLIERLRRYHNKKYNKKLTRDEVSFEYFMRESTPADLFCSGF